MSANDTVDSDILPTVPTSTAALSTTPTVSLLVEQLLSLEHSLGPDVDTGVYTGVDTGLGRDVDANADVEVDTSECGVPESNENPFNPADSVRLSTKNEEEKVKNVENLNMKNEEDLLRYSRIHGYKVAMGGDDSFRYKSILDSIRQRSSGGGSGLDDHSESKSKSKSKHGSHNGSRLNIRPTANGKDAELSKSWDEFYTMGLVEGQLSQLQWKPLKGSAECDEDAMMEQPERYQYVCICRCI